MVDLIVTHPGGAHKDEFLACAVLLSKAPVTIERREPTAGELESASVAIVDIGHEYNTKLHNFDHHQFPRDQIPTCALSLILKHLEIYEDAREFCSWLEVAEWFDCRGPVDTAEWLKIDRHTLSQLNSPLDITLLRRFANQGEHKPGEPIWEMMRMIGEDLVDYITGLRKRLDFVAKNAEIWDLDHFKVLFMPRTETISDEVSSGLVHHIEKLGLEDEVLALAYPDSRGTGYGMRRYKDDTRMEFTQIRDESDVHFTHARGFIAKTSSSDQARIKELLLQSYKNP